MSVIVVGAEKNFAALRPRLFAEAVSSRTAGEVSAAIQAANPHADLKALAPGTVLVVPDDLPHVVVRGGLSLDEGAKGAVAAVLAAAEAALAGLSSSPDEPAAARKRLVRTLSGEQVAAAAAKDRTIAAALKAAREALDEADALAKARADGLRQARSEWGAELEALRATLPS